MAATHKTPLDHITLASLALLAIALAIPPKYGPWPAGLLGLAALTEIARQIHRRRQSSASATKTVIADVAALGYFALLLWHGITANTRWLDAMFFPQPETVLRLFFLETPTLASGALPSLLKLFIGYAVALSAGIGLGLVIGWNKRLYHAAAPVAKALGPVPPVIYIPYAICFLPNLQWAQVFVIFIGAFWPVFLSALNGVQGISRSHLDVAATLNLGQISLLWKVILPGALPSICAGAVLGLVFSFILLTAAELIGSSSGLGWYIKNFADFGDFSRVLVGIGFTCALVIAVTSVTDWFEGRLLAWCE